MQRNIIETIIGAVVLLVATGFVVFAFSIGGLDGIGSGYSVTARFDDATGVTAGTDVRMSGVKIGTVASQTLDPKTFDAVVAMTIQDGVPLPADSSARIVPDGLLGGNFIDVQPGGALDDIKPGGSIGRTQGAINIVDLVGRFIFGGSGDKGASGDKSPGEPATLQ
ncbi:phospholipid/cholesterol/gamma-HCH transport system substrate-binding protein [Tistlia consotensis]|uniref:Phospholipid/cholesterol/gamma-HCH transport system substrate-binding protein n=1 Tax=Tistlia consotensis USBA 355 TaxID=560819 RepID=A0A1Y6B235_9PROT|nr:outer membrane lipid asymmetry maintenance protein MlaD [Tistlia consotensis]SME87725.1 phospholipid/cholesterol/gamma-HCH transport system substrate-binding protein [Tistlia consotensis USBA 355]SNR24066.1 phospholipid/cholesterol/gamma-HCH transport system substrate-binding protein [Tistlia consotensis]